MEKDDKNKPVLPKPKDKEKNQNLGNKGIILDFVRINTADYWPVFFEIIIYF